MFSYYNISYNSAKDFLKSLPSAKIQDLCDLYNIDLNKKDSGNAAITTGTTRISEGFQQIGDVIPTDDNSYDDIDELAAVVADKDLIDLGYIDKSNDKEEYLDDSTDNEEYTNNLVSVIAFLSSLDEDTLHDLLGNYAAFDVEDLAIGITDAELERLGFEPFTNAYEYDEDDFSPDATYNEIPSYNFETKCGDLCGDERFDFLEDVDYSIPIIVVDSDELIFGTDDYYDYEAIRSQLSPDLVETCEKVSFGDDMGNIVLFKITPIDYSGIQVSEEVVVNSELNPELFDNETDKLKSDVLQQLLDYVNGFMMKMREKSINVDYSDLQLVGSNAGYLYTPESDIDLHFIWAYPMEADNFEQMRAEFYDYIAENPLYIGKNGVEINLEDGMNMEATNTRRYSLINDNWVDGTENLEVYTPDDVYKVEGYEDVVADYTSKIDNAIKSDSYAEAIDVKNELRNNRSEDLRTKGSLSMGNVVYKELRNNGKIDELREFIMSKELEAKDNTMDGE